MPFLSVQDCDLYYEVHGSGPPFLFCSATTTNGDVWKFFQVPEFSRDHSVIIYDQRGVGRSPSRSNDFSVERLAADAAALIDAVDRGPAIVLGHSNGGRVAQSLTLDYPDKVDRLILASAGGSHGVKGIPLSICLSLVEKGYDRQLRDHAIEAGFTKDYIRNNPEALERFLKVRLAGSPPLEVYLRHVIGRQAFDAGDRPKEIAVPTLVMIGDDEGHGREGLPTHADFARELAGQIKGAELVVLKDQGHYYYYSDPAATHAAIRAFLAR